MDKEIWMDGEYSHHKINYSVLNKERDTLRVSRETLIKLTEQMEKPTYVVYDRRSLKPVSICSTLEKAEDWIGLFPAFYNIEVWEIDSLPPLEPHGFYVNANLASGQIIECTPYISKIQWSILIDNFQITEKTIKPNVLVTVTDKILIASFRTKTIEETHLEFIKLRNRMLMHFNETEIIPNGLYRKDTLKPTKSGDTLGEAR